MTFQTLLLAMTVLFFYGLFRWRLMRSTHAIRIKVGREAIRCADNPLITEQAQASLRKMAELMYRPAAPWLVVAALIRAAFYPAKRFDPTMISKDQETAERVLGLKLKLILLLITTSPLACMVGVVAVLLGLGLRVCVMSMAALSETMWPKALLQVVSNAGDSVFLIFPANQVNKARSWSGLSKP